MKNKMITIVIILILFSCKEREDAPIEIDLSESINSKEKVFLSEIASAIDYIPLQSINDS